jgi:hypothetical protein
MPYRHAHWILLLALAPAIATAFWRDYFGTIASAPFAFHVHGLTAIAWIALVALQSWSAHARRLPLHRASGRAVLFVVPLFACGAALVLHSMAVKYAGQSHPFYARFGPRLGMHDLISTVALVAMVRAALVQRRRVGLHAGYMLATVLLVLPPILARLPIGAPPALHLGELTAGLAALALYAGRRRDGMPFLIVTAVMLLEVLAFESFGASSAWSGLFARIARWPVLPLAFGALTISALALWSARNPWGKRPVRGAKGEAGTPALR